jgi:predicted signal transduction protein with EAL and GGDEF domain
MIVDRAKAHHDVATDENGLPDNFDEASSRLQIIRSILKYIEAQVQNLEVDEATCIAMMPIVVACEQKARKLEETFQKILPQTVKSRPDRYIGAAEALGSGPRVETLLKGMLEDIQLLASNHGIRGFTNFQLQEIAEAIKEISESELLMHQSIPKGLLDYSRW